MKVLVFLAVLVMGGSLLLTKGLEAVAPGAAQHANREIEAYSVADYCTQAIP